jgi:hypothetical protein
MSKWSNDRSGANVSYQTLTKPPSGTTLLPACLSLVRSFTPLAARLATKITLRLCRCNIGSLFITYGSWSLNQLLKFWTVKRNTMLDIVHWMRKIDIHKKWQYNDNQSPEDESRANSRNVVWAYIKYTQTMDNIQHCVSIMNQPLSRTFRESVNENSLFLSYLEFECPT